jgi:hypothetical protein
MNLFFLIAEDSDGAGPFLRSVLHLVPEDKLEVFDGFSEFSERLRRPRDLSSAVLVVGPSPDDLKKLVSLKNNLKDVKILLVMAESTPETIALAHRVMPTYISDIENGPTGVVSVLNRVLRDPGAAGSPR